MGLIWPAPVAGQVSSGLLSLLQPGGSGPGQVLPDAFQSNFQDTVAFSRGWWSHAPDVCRPSFSIQRKQFQPVTRRLTRDRSWMQDRATMLRSRASLAAGPLRISAEGLGRRVTHGAGFQGDDGQARLSGSGDQAAVYLRVHSPSHGLSVLAGGPVWRADDDKAEYERGAAVRWRPNPRWQLQAGRTEDIARYDLGGVVLEDPVPLALDLKRRKWRADTRWRAADRLAVEIQWRNTQLASNNTVTDAPIFDALLDGEGRGWTALLTAETHAGHQIVYRELFEFMDIYADAFKTGQQFGWLNYFRLDVKSHLLGWRQRPADPAGWQFEIEKSTTNIESRLKVESWPFTSAVVDLMGLSRIYYGTLDMESWRLTALRRGRTEHLSWRAGCSLIDVRPQGDLKSWIPAFLGVGVSDVEFSVLDVHSARAASLLLQGRWSMGRVAVDLALQQFVWGRVVDLDDTPDEADSGGPDVDHNGWYGGTWLRAGISLRL
jgi:hypothetical protein